MIKLNEINFDKEVNQSSIPVLVGFCREPTEHDISLPDHKCCSVDVVKSAGLAKKFGISNIPTILRFNNGKVTDTIVGSVKKEQLFKIFR